MRGTILGIPNALTNYANVNSNGVIDWAPGFPRRTAINLSGGLNELTDGDGLLSGRRHRGGGGEKSIHIGNPG